MATCCRDVRRLGGPATGVFRGEMVPLGVSAGGRYKTEKRYVKSSLYTANVNSYSQIRKMVVENWKW